MFHLSASAIYRGSLFKTHGSNVLTENQRPEYVSPGSSGFDAEAGMRRRSRLLLPLIPGGEDVHAKRSETVPSPERQAAWLNEDIEPPAIR
jgi:hypothetical protein